MKFATRAAMVVVAVLTTSSQALWSQKSTSAGSQAQPKVSRTGPGVAEKLAAQQPVKATKVTTVEGITEYTLSNGLRVLLFPDQSKPTVTVNMTYLVGSRHEGYGEMGMAHLIEHMIFKGTTNHRNIPKELTDHGSRPNGSTWYDRTNYFETVPASDENLNWALDLEADRMVNCLMLKQDLESEFTVVRNEFELGENSPVGVTLERVMAAAYLWHGYGRSTIGNKADIEGVPIERLKVFYKKYYQPDNAVLVVAGKFDEAKTLGVIERTYGAIPKAKRSLEAGNLLFATYTQEPVQDGERFETVRRTGDAQVLMAGYHIPAGSHPDFPAVAVLENTLTNNPSGRLYKALVETKLAADINGFPFQLKEPGMLLLFSTVRLEQSLDSARWAMEKALDDTRTATFTDEEVNRAKASLLKNIEIELNNSESIGYDLTEWAAMGDWRLFFINRDRIERVTTADVQRVAALYLKSSNRTVAEFIPTKTPDRTEVPATPNISAIVAGYKGRAAIAAGEAFDPSPKNIDARTKHSVLASGMNVSLLSKTTRGGRVVANITLRFGTAETLTGKNAVADMTNDMLSRGTAALTRTQVKDSLDKLKAQVSIGGASNNVVARIETVRDNLLPVLDLVASEMRSPRFDASEFAALLQEDLAQAEQIKSEPQVLASTAMNRALLPMPKGHPLYTPTVDEQIADYKAVTLDQVKAFHHDFFGATYADVAVIGDFDATQVSAALAKAFGDWKSPQPFARLVRTYAQGDTGLKSIEAPDKANAWFFAGQNLQLRDDDADYPSMVLGNFMIGGGFLNSRLPMRLRQKEGLSYGVGSNVSAQSMDRFGQFQAYAIYAPQNALRLVQGFKEEISKVVSDGFTADEVAAAKSGYLQVAQPGSSERR
ncbi:MAG TPA: pitrilysin family protein [Gemmatimonadaceae bacterium]